MNSNKIITTTRMPPELVMEIQCLCAVMGTSYQSKFNELLMEWRIETVNRIKNEAPEIYQRYLDLLDAMKKAPPKPKKAPPESKEVKSTKVYAKENTKNKKAATIDSSKTKGIKGNLTNDLLPPAAPPNNQVGNKDDAKDQPVLNGT